MTLNDIRLTNGDASVSIRPDAAPRHFGFLLVPDFALLAYASAIEPLRAANRLSGKTLYRWSHVSVDGAAVAASNGVQVQADFALASAPALDTLIVCAGGNPARFSHMPTFGWLRMLARRGVTLGGVSGGPYLLARAGVITGYRCTIHWEHAPAFLEDFPHLDLRRSLFEIDRDRFTAGGGTASLDMMHAIITREHGSTLALAVSEWFLQTHVREGSEPQRMPLRERLGVSNPAILAAVRLMEQNIEAPRTRAELAGRTGVSLRQLERLFRFHLGQSIGTYYLALRLGRARHLLRQTSLSVLEIGLACGFGSASHFSRAYRARFSLPPSAERIAEIGTPGR
jgi:transcriptional regulator GlxA family with amidase domain